MPRDQSAGGCVSVATDARPRIALIAAVDRQLGLGKDNTLVWHLPEDLRRFKQLTMGATLLMGRKTAESLGRALPGRTNLVLTRSGQVPYAGMQAVTRLQDALEQTNGERLWVLGGGEIYRLALPLADEIHLTRVDAEFDVDTWFPPIAEDEWQTVESEHYPAGAERKLGFSLITLRRVTN